MKKKKIKLLSQIKNIMKIYYSNARKRFIIQNNFVQMHQLEWKLFRIKINNCLTSQKNMMDYLKNKKIKLKVFMNNKDFIKKNASNLNHRLICKMINGRLGLIMKT